MIMLANYHTHTLFCDGKVSPEAMAEAAFKVGYRVLGFSAHAPVPLPSAGNLSVDRVAPYAQAVRDTAALFEGRMEVLAGLELEWVPGLGIPSLDGYASVPMDYRIGSLHYVKAPSGEFFTVDCPEDEFDRSMANGYAWDGERLYKDYYRELAALIRCGGFEILGHFDILKKNNAGCKWFDGTDPAYLKAAFEAVEALEGTGIVAEINTGGMARRKTIEPYPSMPILKEMRRRKIPVLIGADAHDRSHLGMKWRRLGVRWARSAGYRELVVFSGGQWSTGPVE
jgi:histidinol-phosphatase (PHP family)